MTTLHMFLKQMKNKYLPLVANMSLGFSQWGIRLRMDLFFPKLIVCPTENHTTSLVSYSDLCWCFSGEEEYNCFTMLCQPLPYNEVNQLYVCIYPLPLGPLPHPTLLGHHRAELPVLQSSFPLASYVTHGGVDTAVSISQIIPLSLSPPCPRVYSLCLHLSSCPVNRFKTGKPGMLQSMGLQRIRHD